MTSMLRYLTPALAAAVLLGGCDRIGNPLEALGQQPPPPDEFAVVKRKPLMMPPALALPEPRPGAPSPLDPNPELEAQAALLGTAAVAAPPNPAGEAALLSAADAGAASNDIRVQLTLDAGQEESGEYQPPTILELFGLGDGEEAIDEAARLDPVAESQRLQRQGVIAPADPDAAAATAATSEVVGVESTGPRLFRPPRVNSP